LDATYRRNSILKMETAVLLKSFQSFVRTHSVISYSKYFIDMPKCIRILLLIKIKMLLVS